MATVVTDSTQTKPLGAVRVVCISDTHGHGVTEIADLPDGDILLHGGDLTFLGRDESDIERFNTLLDSVKHKYKDIIVIAGNHDILLDESSCNKISFKRGMARLYFGQMPRLQRIDPKRMKSLIRHCQYLEDSFVICQGLKIYGSPWVPAHFDLAFNLRTPHELLEKWNLIPKDTDILITHGPPYGYGDEIKPGVHVGCSQLLETVKSKLQLKLHLFGHIHEGYGITKVDNTIFANAAVCDPNYKVTRPPLIFDIHPTDEAPFDK